MTDWWTAWWAALAGPDKVFWAIALFTSAVLAIQVLLMLLGFDGDGDVDVDVDTDIDHPDGGGVLSVRTITAFFTGFGWGGVVALDNGMTILSAVAVATFSGGVLMFTVYFLMQGLYSMRYSGTLDYRGAIGTSANVYLPIPPNMEGTGQVKVPLQGRLLTLEAMTRAETRLPNRMRVRVVDLVDASTLLVEPLGELSPPAGEART